MARRKRHHDDDDKHRKHRKHHGPDPDPRPKPKPKPVPSPGGGGTPPPGNITEQLRGKSTQTGEDAMNAAPTSMPEEATAAALYSTGPGEVVAYDYQRTGTYADEYNAQQHVDVQGQTLAGAGQGGFL